MSSASLMFPTTPPAKLRPNATPWYTRPSTSSPLAHQSSSPIAEAQARRRSQFKSQSSSRDNGASSFCRNSSKSSSSSRYATPAQLASANETPQVAFLRQRFKSKCVERVKKARQRDRDMRRWTSDTSSDGFDVEMDPSSDNDDERADDDAVINDEFFRRIIANERRKTEHAYRLSYELDVGSSVDPDMMDVAEWEEELKRNDHGDDEDERPPEDLFDIVDDDELVALYEEYEQEQQRQQSRQQDEQHWEALLDDPLQYELPCDDTNISTDQMES